MDESEKSWALKASDLNNCPYYTKGDSLQVQMPGVFGNQLTHVLHAGRYLHPRGHGRHHAPKGISKPATRTAPAAGASAS